MDVRFFAAAPGLRGVIAGMLLGCVTLAQAEEAEAWLERMQEAVEATNYEGTLVHMTPGRAEQFRVYHRVVDSLVTERLVLVDGMGAEIIRTPEEVICIFPKQRSVVVESRVSAQLEASPLEASLPSISTMAATHYEVAIDREDRVAERDTLVIAISPRDNFRYGYRLWLDTETAMPLKSQLIGTDPGMPLEEIRFVAIALPERVSEESVLPATDTAEFAVTHHARPPARSAVDGGVIDWAATDLPPGFMLSVSRYEFLEGQDNPRMHLVYTDGLASVSVFLDKPGESGEQVEGLSTMGASNAYTVMKNDLLVTAMGEVPAGTVEQIAVSMSQGE